ncbi:MAG: hypothetical protein WBA88_02900 [Pseudaminobacter sp.]
MKLLAAEQKIARTDAAARQILNAEANARQKKTARLRQLRLEREEAERNEAAQNPTPARRTRKQATKSAVGAQH